MQICRAGDVVSAHHPGKRMMIAGCPIDALTFEETIAEVGRLIEAGRPVQHCVVNASKAVMMHKDRDLMRIIAACELVNADGQAVVWASRLLGRPLPERVAGIDLFLGLLGLAEDRRYPVFFLGATQHVVDAVVERAHRDYPRLIVCGARNGYWAPSEADQVVRTVKAAGARMLFVGIPSPRKEYWLASNLGALGVPFSMGVGGSFDVFAGIVRRAPLWMQRIGLEWMFRFLQEPRRMWKRYLLGNAAFVRLVIKAWVADRRPAARRHL
jgi:N-acetylglucosaminyldiphosphoundecaprenol N-acetyl-beta-D-mannosaminyltransferase